MQIINQMKQILELKKKGKSKEKHENSFGKQHDITFIESLYRFHSFFHTYLSSKINQFYELEVNDLKQFYTN